VTLPLALGAIYPTPPPPDWKHVGAAGSIVWYPPALRPIATGAGSVSLGEKDARGNVLVSLTSTPRAYAANMTPQSIAQRTGWPAFRYGQLRAAGATAVREDARAISIAVHGGIGACVMDDYVSHAKQIPYREIACLMQDGTDSVFVASVQTSAWSRFGVDLEDAVDAYGAP
jgi:hypothetical protein